MHLYDCASAPSPRRVRIYLAEKGLSVPLVPVDLRSGEHLEAAYRAINPRCDVPFLVLEDGTGIGEVEAICRYFEDIHPEPPLFGREAREKALVSMWSHRMELEGFQAVQEVLRNSAKGFVGRAVTGPVSHAQIPALAERGRRRLDDFMRNLDAHLADRDFMIGDSFTFADITAFVCVDFAAWVKVKPGPEHPHLRRWHETMQGRNSADA
ncbi:glutathione S-transferase [Magnetospira thiophila]